MSSDKVGDTPRTNMVTRKSESGREVVDADVARQLERELADYKRLNAALTETLEVAQRDAALKASLVSAGTPREQALAEALQLVLDDWANSNTILDDAMDRAHAALSMQSHVGEQCRWPACESTGIQCPRGCDTSTGTPPKRCPKCGAAEKLEDCAAKDCPALDVAPSSTRTIHPDELESLTHRWHQGRLDAPTLVTKLEGIIEYMRNASLSASGEEKK